MLIKDPYGKYEIKVDVERGLVYEKDTGLWSKEDFHRFHNDYVVKVLPLLNGKEWFKYGDLSNCKILDISEEINQHAKWCVENRMFGTIAVITDEAIKMQVDLGAIYSGSVFGPLIFSTTEEADKWIASHWI